MPYLELVTNVKIADAKAFAKEFSKVGAEVLNKPEKYISVSYAYNEILTFGGTLDPAFHLKVTSVGNINATANVKHSKKLYQFLKEKLGLEDNRGYIIFYEPGTENIGYRSTTLAYQYY